MSDAFRETPGSPPPDLAITASPPAPDGPSIVKEYHASFLRIITYNALWVLALLVMFLLLLFFS